MLALTGCYRFQTGWSHDDFATPQGLLYLDFAGGNGTEKENFSTLMASSNTCLLYTSLLLWAGVLEAQTYQVPVSEKNEKMQEGEFEPTWESLQNYKVPEWFRNVKFGIWAHWGPQCVEGSGDWMARSLYLEGSREYKHHVEHYGHPSEVGFKDVYKRQEKRNAQHGIKTCPTTKTNHNNT